MQCSSLSVSDSWYWQKSPKKSGKHIHVACPLLSSQVPFPQWWNKHGEPTYVYTVMMGRTNASMLHTVWCSKYINGSHAACPALYTNLHSLEVGYQGIHCLDTRSSSHCRSQHMFRHSDKDCWHTNPRLCCTCPQSSLLGTHRWSCSGHWCRCLRSRTADPHSCPPGLHTSSQCTPWDRCSWTAHLHRFHHFHKHYCSYTLYIGRRGGGGQITWDWTNAHIYAHTASNPN